MGHPVGQGTDIELGLDHLGTKRVDGRAESIEREADRAQTRSGTAGKRANEPQRRSGICAHIRDSGPAGDGGAQSLGDQLEPSPSDA